MSSVVDLRRHDLGGTWKNFPHAVIHVATVGGELNVLTQVQPIVIGAALSNTLSVILGFPE